MTITAKHAFLLATHCYSIEANPLCLENPFAEALDLARYSLVNREGMIAKIATDAHHFGKICDEGVESEADPEY
ncbi:MAG TPA: hypothetical protein VMM84_02030 [Pyrinomonadaceae bacterium]|nr:hypothetical protein [Pyrinomonadaceae bacterium]